MPQIVQHNQWEPCSLNKRTVLFQQVARITGGSDRAREDAPQILPCITRCQSFLELPISVSLKGGNSRGSKAYAPPATANSHCCHVG